MSQYSLIFQEVEQGVSDLDAAGKAIASQLEELDTQAKQQLSTWSGAAQEQYQGYKNKWTASAQQMSSVALSASQIMSEINDTYKGTESNIANQWS